MVTYPQGLNKYFFKKIIIFILARAAWFAYLSPDDVDELLSCVRESRVPDPARFPDARDAALTDFIKIIKKPPIYVHSPVEDTDCYLVETIDNELWVS